MEEATEEETLVEEPAVEELEPSDETYHARYSESFILWSAQRTQALLNPEVPPQVFAPADLVRHWPPFPPPEEIDCEGSSAFATGFTTWESEMRGCRHMFNDPSSNVFGFTLQASTSKPVNVSISKNSGDGYSRVTWLPPDAPNYISVCFLAWNYILSARWAESMPDDSTISYTPCHALTTYVARRDRPDKLFAHVNVGDHSAREGLWWAAVLAPCGG